MIKVADLAWVRFTAPDLDEMERFLLEFGMVRAERTDEALYMRGSDPDAWIHETRLGEPGFAGLAFDVDSESDLEAATQIDGASAIELVTEPGGGRRVRMTDPDGVPVELVHGRAPAESIPMQSTLPLNVQGATPRVGARQVVPKGPAQVKRLGHVVVVSGDFATTSAWYEANLGFLRSDEMVLGDPDNVVLVFFRCDRGSRPADHHTFLCVGVGEPGFEHAAFEVHDIDAVMAGHDHLKGAGRDHLMGIGRHFLGGQVFDYWKDPWGHTVEHFTDGDLFDDSHKPERHEPQVVLGTHWGSAARES